MPTTWRKEDLESGQPLSDRRWQAQPVSLTANESNGRNFEGLAGHFDPPDRAFSGGGSPSWDRLACSSDARLEVDALPVARLGEAHGL
jgi:hypothetical protein